jgi:hypothetical protein
MDTSSVSRPRSLARRIFRIFGVLAMLGVLGIAVLLGSLWLEHKTQTTLPTPTRPFAVGRTIYDWADDKTLDALAPVAGTKRELLVWIWYPAAAGQSCDGRLPPRSSATHRRYEDCAHGPSTDPASEVRRPGSEV